jgi:hypothetical protein
MESAQKSITGGLDKFSSILADREQLNQGVADRGRQASQEEYLNLVQSYKTPEELQAARMSGVLDQRLASLDPRNQAAVRGATESRITSLQQQATAGNAFADQTELRNQRSTEEAILTARAQGNTVLADQLTSQLTRNRGTFMQANYDAGRVRDDQTRTTALAVAGQQGKLDAITQTDALNKINYKPALANAQALADLAPEERAQLVITQRLKGIGLNDQARVADNAEQDRLITSMTAEAASQYSKNSQADSLRLGGLATELGMTTNAAGFPDLTRINEADNKRLNAAAKTRGLISTEQMNSGDTVMANRFVTNMRSDPRFTSESIERNLAKMRSSFDKTGQIAPVGADAAAIRLSQAKEQVMDAEIKASNWYAPGNADAKKSYEVLAKEIEPMFNAASNMSEDLPDIQNLLYKAATTGIKMPDGRFLTPSTQDMLAAVRSQMGKNNFTNAGRAKDIEQYLKDNMDTARVTKLLEQAAASEKTTRARAVRNLLDTPPAASK